MLFAHTGLKVDFPAESLMSVSAFKRYMDQEEHLVGGRLHSCGLPVSAALTSYREQVFGTLLPVSSLPVSMETLLAPLWLKLYGCVDASTGL